MKRRKSILIVAALLLLTLSGCMNEENGNSESAERVRMVPVETMEVERGSFEDFIRLTGVIEALDDAVISSESSGRVESILERGESVGQGEVIARMDDRLSRAQYEAAKTSFELAEDTYNRMRSLYEDDIISTQDYRAARAQRDQARSQLSQAEKQLNDSDIEAPFGGRIEERFVSKGELVSPGVPVVRLVDNSRVRVVAGIPERYSGQIGSGSPARVMIRALGNRRMESQVTFAGELIDAATRTFPIEVELDNFHGDLKPEMVVDLQVKRTTIENAIVIPRTAIVRDESALYVFRVKEEGGHPVAELVEVQAGFAYGALIEISSGLESGDRVVVAGLSSLNMGDRLNIVQSSSSDEKISTLQSRR